MVVVVVVVEVVVVELVVERGGLVGGAHATANKPKLMPKTQSLVNLRISSSSPIPSLSALHKLMRLAIERADSVRSRQTHFRGLGAALPPTDKVRGGEMIG